MRCRSSHFSRTIGEKPQELRPEVTNRAPPSHPKAMLPARFIGRIGALAAVTLVLMRVTLAQPLPPQPTKAGAVSELYRELGNTALDHNEFTKCAMPPSTAL